MIMPGHLNNGHSSSSTQPVSNGRLQLVLAGGTFAFCFAVFGATSAMMPILRKRLDLIPIQASIAMRSLSHADRSAREP
jgi:hypothetical protein